MAIYRASKPSASDPEAVLEVEIDTELGIEIFVVDRDEYEGIKLSWQSVSWVVDQIQAAAADVEAEEDYDE